MDEKKLRILVVDDDEEDYLIVRRVLAGADDGPYCFEFAPTADMARAALADARHDVALVDYRLGADDGLDLVREASAAGCPVPLILLTGRGAPEVGDEALRAGATDYIPKGRFDADGLARAIRHAVLRRRVEDRLRSSEREACRLALVARHTDNAVIIADPEGRIEWVNDAFTRMTGYTLEEACGRKPGDLLQGPGTDSLTVANMGQQTRAGQGFNVEVLNYAKSGREYWLAIDCQPVRDGEGQLLGFVAIESDVTERWRVATEAIQARAELETAYDATIEGWARALDLRDHETEGHSRRVTEMTVRLARAMGLSEVDLIQVRRGALLHDIGKMGVPDAILRKPGPLDDDEWKVMKQHPSLALDMLAPIDFLRTALEIPYCHHEKWDGTGYPRGLKREAIPLAARIFAAVDIWDARSNDRPYRKAWEPSRVREHICSLAGSHLDPDITAAFLPMIEPGAGDSAAIGSRLGARELQWQGHVFSASPPPINGSPSACPSPRRSGMNDIVAII
jgi:PAS domain S-box-containing protein/putative nucleotidyltransferase with HDIG domain